MIENYIPIEDVLIRIKYHPDITKQEKEQYIESMRERIRSMQFTLSCIVHYDNVEKMDELNKTQ